MNAKNTFWIAIVVMVAILAGALGYVVGNNQSEDEDDAEAAAETSDVQEFTLAQLAEFDTEDNCYIAYDGSVYDVTEYMNQHPAGPESIIARCGEDTTAGFDAVGAHGGVSPSDFEPFFVGELVE